MALLECPGSMKPNTSHRPGAGKKCTLHFAIKISFIIVGYLGEELIGEHRKIQIMQQSNRSLQAIMRMWAELWRWFCTTDCCHVLMRSSTRNQINTPAQTANKSINTSQRSYENTVYSNICCFKIKSCLLLLNKHLTKEKMPNSRRWIRQELGKSILV